MSWTLAPKAGELLGVLSPPFLTVSCAVAGPQGEELGRGWKGQELGVLATVGLVEGRC